MNNCIEALSLNGEAVKSKTANTARKLNEESFEMALNKILSNKEINLSKSPLVKSSSSDAPKTLEAIEEERASRMKLQMKIDEAMDRLGSFFGFGKTIMEGILKSLKISPEDLLDPAKREYIVKLLARKLGLAKDKEEALDELIASFQS